MNTLEKNIETSNHLARTIDLNVPNTRHLASQDSRRKKLLFFAEDVTLAHVGRMIALAGSLDQGKYDILIACGKRYRHFVEAAGLRAVHIDSMSPETFARSVSNGTPIYTSERLQCYVNDDLALIARESPDLVVGDFRLSLGISSELTRIPYVAVMNGHWSPYSTLKLPLPEHPLVRWLGVTVASTVFPVVKPIVLRQHTAPFNKIRSALGLPKLDSWYEVSTHATCTLYPDIPTLAPTEDLPSNHSYMGPVIWEPEVPLPDWWNQLPDDRPIVYLNVGSSGDHRIFNSVVRGLSDMPVTVIAATAERDVVSCIPDNVYIAYYLPGMECAKRASLVVCNGGSGTIYQALHHGVPVLGIPSNADQYLCMGALVSEGAGRLVRSGKVTPELLRQHVVQIIKDKIFTQRANDLSIEIARYDAKRTFFLRLAGCVNGIEYRDEKMGVAHA